VIKKVFVSIIFGVTLFGLSFDYDTFEASFTQTIKNKSGKKIEYSGRVVAKKPNLALWEYTKPVKKTVYINSDNVIVYEPALTQAKYLKKRGSLSLESILAKAKLDTENEYVAKDGDVTYRFSVSNNMIEKLTYKDSLENDTEIIFANRKKNTAVSNAVFTFNPPPDIDILK